LAIAIATIGSQAAIDFSGEGTLEHYTLTAGDR
jgi:hypothetical protein